MMLSASIATLELADCKELPRNAWKVPYGLVKGRSGA